MLVLGPAALGVGVLGGTAAGGLHHKGLKLSDEDKARISADLGSGKAAVGVLDKIEDAPADQQRLTGSWAARLLEPRCGRRVGSSDGSGAVGVAHRQRRRAPRHTVARPGERTA